MKSLSYQSSRRRAFTLLEVVIVLAITAMVLGAVYSLAQGTLTLADDVSRTQRRDTRIQAFTGFCEHLFGELPPGALLNISVTQEGGQYLSTLELEHAHSPFDETPDCRVCLITEARPGGGLRLWLTCKSEISEAIANSAVLFEDMVQCEWSVFHPTTQQWTSFWSETGPSSVSTAQTHPRLVKLVMCESGSVLCERVFWIAPNES